DLPKRDRMEHETQRMTDGQPTNNKYEPVGTTRKRCDKTACLWGFAKFFIFILFLALLAVIVDQTNSFRNSDPNWIRYTNDVPLQTVSKATRVSWLYNSQEVVR